MFVQFDCLRTYFVNFASNVTQLAFERRTEVLNVATRPERGREYSEFVNGLEVSQLGPLKLFPLLLLVGLGW